MKVLKDIMKQKETSLGIGAAIAFQVVFIIVWLTGYNGVYDRIDQMKIGIVNDDNVLGEEITNELLNVNEFTTILYEDRATAEADLDARKMQMLIYIPNNLTEHLQGDQQGNIDYIINQSVPTLEKQMMEQIAATIHATLDEQTTVKLHTQLNEQLPKIIAAQSKDPQMAEKIAQETIVAMQDKTASYSIKDNVIKTNEKDGFQNTMIPLLIILASYIGAMLVSQHLQFVAMKLQDTYHVMTLFAARQVINIFVAILITLLTFLLLTAFQVDITHNFFMFSLFQAILIYSFLALSQVFVFILGNIGMLFNIALTALQLVSSGAIVPRDLLSPFYQQLGSILPATYGVNGYFSLIYGGGNLTNDMKSLLLLTFVLLFIAIGGKISILIFRNVVK